MRLKLILGFKGEIKIKSLDLKLNHNSVRGRSQITSRF